MSLLIRILDSMTSEEPIQASSSPPVQSAGVYKSKLQIVRLCPVAALRRLFGLYASSLMYWIPLEKSRTQTISSFNNTPSS